MLKLTTRINGKKIGIAMIMDQRRATERQTTGQIGNVLRVKTVMATGKTARIVIGKVGRKTTIKNGD